MEWGNIKAIKELYQTQIDTIDKLIIGEADYDQVKKLIRLRGEVRNEMNEKLEKQIEFNKALEDK